MIKFKPIEGSATAKPAKKKRGSPKAKAGKTGKRMTASRAKPAILMGS